MFDKKRNLQSGQILLAAVMLLATAVTLVTATVFKSNTDTQLAKLEEDQQKTLAAAESGIEQALNAKINSGSVAITGVPNFSGTASVNNSSSSTTFISPLIAKDQQYTFYLADYSTGTFGASYTDGITVYYDSENRGCDNLGLELTFIYGNGSYSVERYIANTGGQIAGSSTNSIGQGGGTSISGVNFNCHADISTLPVDVKLLIIRSLFLSTKIGVKSMNNVPLEPQGKFITSEAQSTSGVSKKVQLFQSFPQIPADFFVSTF